MDEKKDALDEEEFYELMQSYRHMPLQEDRAIIKAFEDVKEFVRDYIKSLLEHHKEQEK